MKKTRTRVCVWLVLVSIIAVWQGMSCMGCHALADAPAPVTIHVMLNQTELHSPEVAHYYACAQDYTRAHPEVTFYWDLYDAATYPLRLRTYAGRYDMPDIFLLFQDASVLLPYTAAGLVAPIPAERFGDYAFLPGALEGFTLGDTLYALPTRTDYRFILYNQLLFDRYGLEAPDTLERLERAVRVFREKGIIPMSTAGTYTTRQTELFADLCLKLAGGDAQIVDDALAQRSTFAQTPSFIEGADIMGRLVAAGLFQDDWERDGYLAARMMFMEQKAAMFYSGTWDFGITKDESLPLAFRKGVRCVPFPAPEGAGAHTVTTGAINAGLAIGADTEHYDVALDILQEWMRPEVHAKAWWEQMLGAPAQTFDGYVTGQENQLQLDFYAIVKAGRPLSGSLFPWRLSPVFEEETKQNLHLFLTAEIDGPELLRRLDRDAAEGWAPQAVPVRK